MLGSVRGVPGNRHSYRDPFHAQQAVEKCFKALMEEHAVDARKIHSLVTLYAKVEIFLVPHKLDIRMMRILDSLYIDARYPGDLGLLPDGLPTRDEALSFQAYALNVYDLVFSSL